MIYNRDEEEIKENTEQAVESQDNQDKQDKNNNNTKKCCSELQEAKNRSLYLMAEFENYKRRTEKERSQCILYGETIVLKETLSIVDDFERAFKQIEAQELSESLVKDLEGFKIILKSFHKLLDKYEVSEINYGEFDPEIHEAIMQVESDKHKPGQIVEVFQKGYKHKGQLLRPARVSVAK